MKNLLVLNQMVSKKDNTILSQMRINLWWSTCISMLRWFHTMKYNGSTNPREMFPKNEETF